MEQNKFQALVLEALQVLLVKNPGDAGEETRDKLIEKIQMEVTKG